MTITPTGQATIRSKDDGQSYVIQAKDIEWNQVGADKRGMGLEVQYLGEIEHPALGSLTWSVSEYPVGAFNDSDHDINGHSLESNFTFDPHFENDADWDDIEAYEGPVNLTNDQLRALPRKQQQAYITAWFYSQFWDPAHETPYDGREGGYQYVHGGPYDAHTELEEKFGGVVKDNVIENAVEEIEADGQTEWAPSPKHPDQLRAAEEYYESLKPQTLDEIRVALANGAATDFGSRAAQTAAEEIKLLADALIAAIEARRPTHGGMGHNGPALDDEGNPLPEGFESELQETANALSVQMEASAPDPMTVVEAATRLKRFRAWLQPRIDMAADEFSKEIGKKGATALIGIGTIALASIVPGLDTVLAAVWNWLQAILV